MGGQIEAVWQMGGGAWARWAVALALHLGVLPAAANAAQQSVVLDPQDATMRLTAYALGLFAMPITVGAFSGTFTYDPSAPADCAVRLTADTGSMHMDDPDRQQTLLGPDLLDAARYQQFVFTGRCVSATRISGELTLHGETKPFSVTIDHGSGRLTATGSLERAEWGITALPLKVGKTIELRFSARLASAPQR